MVRDEAGRGGKKRVGKKTPRADIEEGRKRGHRKDLARQKDCRIPLAAPSLARMSVVEIRSALRQTDRYPLAVALAFSLLIHLALYSSWQVGKQFGWWTHSPTWLTQLTRKLVRATAVPPKKEASRPRDQNIPMTFVEVDPATATADAPADAKYYSSRNAKAANPDPKDLAVPKVDGQQDQIVRLMDNEKPKPFPLQPAPPKPPVPTQPKAEAP